MREGAALTGILIYLALMVAVGVWYGRRVKSNDDFLTGGRTLPRWVLTGTLLATWTGAGTIIGRANFSYTYGPLASVLYCVGAPLGILIMYFFLAQRIRALGAYTIPEIIEQRYGRTVRLVAAGAIVLAYMSIISEQIRALGYIVNLATGLPTTVGELVGLAVILLTAIVGGVLSLAYTDAISSVLITATLLIGVVITMVAVGGFGGLAAELPAQKLNWTGGMSGMQILGFILPTLFLFLGDQNMYQRLGAASSPQVARKAAGGFFFGDVLFYGVVVLMASCSAVLLPHIAPDMAILALAQHQLPLAVGTLIMVTGTAFMITTGNSYVMSAASNLVQDLYHGLSRRPHDERRSLLLTRLTIVVLGLAAYVIGKGFPSVLEIQVFAYTMYGAVITPSVLAVFVSRRVTPAAAIASMATGAIATVVWEFALDKPHDWNSILFSLPLSVLALVAVSCVTRPRPEPGTAAAREAQATS